MEEIINSSEDMKCAGKKLINLGSACIYPKKTKQPIKEDYLLSSDLESSNEGYALAVDESVINMPGYCVASCIVISAVAKLF